MIETPPRSVNLIALPARLNSTWRSRAASPTTLRRQALVDVAADFEALGLGARAEQLDRFLDKGRERERPRVEIEPAGFDLGEIENLLDQRQQRVARGLDRLADRSPAPARAAVSPSRSAMPRMPLSGVRISCDTMARKRDLARFAASAWSRASASARSAVDAVGHVAADALHLAAAVGAHRHLAPGDPARAVGRGDLLVVHAGAVGETRNVALLSTGSAKAVREQAPRAGAGERAERVVGVGDGAAAVAAHDDVALRLEEALGALLRFLDLPVAVGRLVEMRFETAQLRLHLADAGDQDSDGAAGGAEQRRDADRERYGS